MAHRFSPENLTSDDGVRILVVRLSAIGDVLMTSPVPQALREAFPHAHIAWLVEPLSAPLVQINPYVDEVIIIEQMRRWRELLKEGKLAAMASEVRRYGKELRARQFDIAIDCQGLLKSGILAHLSGARQRIGFVPSREYNHLFMSDRVERPPHPTRITQPYLSLLTPLGIPVTPRRPILPIPEEERERAQDFLAAYGLAGEPYVACCLTTSRPQKDWVWPRWRELAEMFWERQGLRTVFVGGPERRVDTLQLIESSPAKPITAVGHTSLLQSAAIVQDARLVVGGDTGLTYAGFATGTPTLTLYGSTDPTWLAEESNVSVCFHPMPCSPCHRRPTCKHFDCMQAITVQEVVDAGVRLLEHRLVAV